MLILGILARARPRPARRAAASPTSRRSGCAGSAPVRRRSSSASATESRAHRRRRRSSRRSGSRCSPPRSGSCSSALWVNRSLPGPEPRLRRHPVERDRHRRQRRPHADLAAEPRAAGFDPADVSIADPHAPRRRRWTRFLLHPGPLADIIPIPFPLIQNVASIGDVFLTAGLGFFLFARSSASRSELDEEERGHPRAARRLGVPTGLAPGDPGAETGLSPALPARPRSSGRSCWAAPAPAWPRRRSRVRASTAATAGTAHGPDPAAAPEARRARPAPPVCPARAQRVVLGAVGRPADLALRRPDPPVRPRRGARDPTGSTVAAGLVVLRRHAPEPVPLAARRHVRRPLGPQGGPDRQRHPAGGGRPADPDRRGHQHRASSTR